MRRYCLVGLVHHTELLSSSPPVPICLDQSRFPDESYFVRNASKLPLLGPAMSPAVYPLINTLPNRSVATELLTSEAEVPICRDQVKLPDASYFVKNAS